MATSPRASAHPDAPRPRAQSASLGVEGAAPVSLDMSYSFPGTTRFRGRDLDKSEATSLNLSAGFPARLGERWVMPLRLDSRNLALASVGGAPLPDRINTLGAQWGLRYRVNARWSVAAQLNTRLYKLEDLDGDDLGLSGGVTALYRRDPSLSLRLGVSFAPDNNLPVLPRIGVQWRPGPDWTVDAGFPRTRLTYQPSERWRLHFGADLNLIVFRSADDLSARTGLPGFNDALGVYRDIRFGAGGGWSPVGGLWLELEAGWSVDREIDYWRVGETVDFAPAPYARIGARLRF